MTKDLSVQFCKELIKNDKDQLKFLNENAKQDDLCDSFLQAYYKIFCSNGVPERVKLLLDKIVK